MDAIVMMSAKLATLGLLKKRYFENKIMMSQFLPMTLSTKFYHMTQIILYEWSCDQNLVTLAFL